MKMMIPYGHTALPVEVSDDNILHVASIEDLPGLGNVEAAVEDAIQHPLGTKPLLELLHPGDTVVIVVNDITRPFFSKILLPPLINELHRTGIRDKDITALIATGMHRPNTDNEIRSMLGDLPDGLRVVNHNARYDKGHIDLGRTMRGTPVVIDRAYMEAKVKVLTGLISPHQQAGFAGGRKSILPGLASYESIQVFHSFPICPKDVAVGQLEGNLTHEEALAAARMAGVDFILNVVPNNRGDIFKVVAGDLHEAWLDGVHSWKQGLEVQIPESADITIVSPGGYPRDINFWQSQKAIASAELTTRKSGIIILVAECIDGLGEEDLKWHEWLVEASKPQEVIERFKQEGYINGSDKSYSFARALCDFRVMVVSGCLPQKLLNQMFFERYDTVQEALESALSSLGHSSRIAVLPQAVECLPRVSEAG